MTAKNTNHNANIGSIIGRANSCELRNNKASGIISVIDGNYINLGGIIGYSVSNIIDQASFMGIISLSRTDDHASVGSLIGYLLTSSIKNYASSGKITLNGNETNEPIGKSENSVIEE
jgi:hypothetical protein